MADLELVGRELDLMRSSRCSSPAPTHLRTSRALLPAVSSDLLAAGRPDATEAEIDGHPRQALRRGERQAGHLSGSTMTGRPAPSCSAPKHHIKYFVAWSCFS